jgi:hypothetical protein
MDLDVGPALPTTLDLILALHPNLVAGNAAKVARSIMTKSVPSKRRVAASKRPVSALCCIYATIRDIRIVAMCGK